MTWDTAVEKFLSVVGMPHVWLTIGLTTTVSFRAWQNRCWPSERKVVELLAYGGGMYGAVGLMGASAFAGAGSAYGFPGMMGGVVILLVSVRGTWDVLRNPGDGRSGLAQAVAVRQEPST